MSGRDFGRGGRGYGDRGDRRGFDDRDGGRGGPRDRDGGYSGPGGPPRRDREGGFPPSRPWERRDEERPSRPAGDRPFDRPAPAENDRDVRVERYYDEPGRPPRDDRNRADRVERPRREREEPRAGGAERETAPRPAPAPAGVPVAPLLPAAPFVMPNPGERIWTYHHLRDSWRDDERLRGWTPSDQDLQEMVEDNIEADPQVNGRDRRAIEVRVAQATVTLTGTVRSRLAKFAAGSDAFWTYGVQEVRNEITVNVRGPQAKHEEVAKAAAPTAAPPAAPATNTRAADESAAPAKRTTRRKAAVEAATAENAGEVEPVQVAPPEASATDTTDEESSTE
jgi:hypothetical protein